MLPVCVRYADEMMREEDKFKGQAQVVAMTALGNVLGNLLGGFIVDYLGVTAMILCGAAAALTGVLLVFFNAKSTYKVK